MLKNKKFARYAIAFNLLGIVFNFMYSGCLLYTSRCV